VINNTVRNHISEAGVRPFGEGRGGVTTREVTYPDISSISTEALAPSAASVAPDPPIPLEGPHPDSVEGLRPGFADVYKEIALTFSHILRSNNKKLLANLLDQSGKIIVDIESLARIISKFLDTPLDSVHIEYVVPESGCLAKACKVYDIVNIRIYHIDFRLGYNEKYNILHDEYAISLSRVIL
jgi:hypothetical protein